MLGAVQVEMLRTLAELGVRPDLVLGTSIGALNEAVLAAQALFAAGAVRRLHELVRSGVAEHPSSPLRRTVTTVLDGRRIENLPVQLTCCAGWTVAPSSTPCLHPARMTMQTTQVHAWDRRRTHRHERARWSVVRVRTGA